MRKIKVCNLRLETVVAAAELNGIKLLYELSEAAAEVGLFACDVDFSWFQREPDEIAESGRPKIAKSFDAVCCFFWLRPVLEVGCGAINENDWNDDEVLGEVAVVEVAAAADVAAVLLLLPPPPCILVIIFRKYFEVLDVVDSLAPVLVPLVVADEDKLVFCLLDWWDARTLRLPDVSDDEFVAARPVLAAVIVAAAAAAAAAAVDDLVLRWSIWKI